jgi:hypothetical protein
VVSLVAHATVSNYSHGTQALTVSHRDEHKSREADKAAQAELNRRIEERNQYLQLITAKRTGDSAQDMPPLACNPADPHKAVFLVTIPITFGRFKLSTNSYNLLAKHVGME